MPRLLLVALAAAVSLSPRVPPSPMRHPCAKRVISDWTKDGQINGNYSQHCLRQAYGSSTPDLADYSSILDDITAAYDRLRNDDAERAEQPRWRRRLHRDERPHQQAHPRGSEEAGRDAPSPTPARPSRSRTALRSLPLPLLILGVVALRRYSLPASPR